VINIVKVVLVLIVMSVIVVLLIFIDQYLNLNANASMVTMMMDILYNVYQYVVINK